MLIASSLHPIGLLSSHNKHFNHARFLAVQWEYVSEGESPYNERVERLDIPAPDSPRIPVGMAPLRSPLQSHATCWTDTDSVRCADLILAC